MAFRQLPSRWRTSTRPSHVIQPRAPLSISRQFSYLASSPFSLALPAAVQLNIPSLLSGIWESILRAVPKKKTSHMKKRSRFMAGKALKDVTSLNKCSACGNVKRAHLLCPYCVKGKLQWLQMKLTWNLTLQSRNSGHVDGEEEVGGGGCVVQDGGLIFGRVEVDWESRHSSAKGSIGQGVWGLWPAYVPGEIRNLQMSIVEFKNQSNFDAIILLPQS